MLFKVEPRMKIYYLSLAIAVPLFALGASSMGDQKEPIGASGASKDELEMNLSFLNLQRDLRTRKVGAEDARVAMWHWHEAQAERRTQIARQQSMRPISMTEAPGLPPIRGSKTASEFAQEVAGYKTQVIGFVGSLSKERNDPERARQEMVSRLESPSAKKMEAELVFAREEVALAATAEVLPLSAEELDLLEGDERFQEEIYSGMYDATNDLLRPGEELRDRIAPIYDRIHAQQK